MYCPVCRFNNKKSKLVLYQNNLTTAVYLCEDTTCRYPEGHQWIEVSRTLEELRLQKSKKEDFPSKESGIQDDVNYGAATDDWLNEPEFLSMFDGNLDDIHQTFESNHNDHNIDEMLADLLKNMESLEPQRAAQSEKSNIDSLPIIEQKDENVKIEETNIVETVDYSFEKMFLEKGNCEEVQQTYNMPFTDHNINPDNDYGPMKTTEAYTHEAIAHEAILKNSPAEEIQIKPKTKVIVNKDPDTELSSQQVLEILSKLPPSNGKTIVLNFKSNNSKKFKNIVFQSKTIKRADS